MARVSNAGERATLRRVTAEEIRQLRQELQCTARELALTLDIDPAEVTAWEQGDRFPTKKLVTEMNRLRERGASAVVRLKKRRGPSISGVARLSDPEFWKVVRKLVEHPELFDQVKNLADDYPDLATPSGG